MINKKLMILAIFIVSLLAVFTISSVSATDNLTDVTEEVLQETPSDDISLNYEGDELISSSSDEGGSDNVTLDESSQNDNLKDEKDTKLFGALQNQINDAENDSTINLTNDYVGVGFGPDPTIIINKPLTINGNGHKLDAYSASGIFTITASNVFIYNVTFIRGYNNNGGAIYNSGENNTIDSCVFVDCTDSDLNAQDSSGGAIWNEYTGANFNVHSCTFSDCYSYNAGAIYNSAPDCTISSCVFVNCISENQGGAISNEGTCIINSSNFSYCSCDSDGGAIWFGGNGTVTNCNFTSNSASDGGAVYFWSTGNVTNCNFVNNSANLCGGAIYGFNDLNIYYSVFVNNSAATGKNIYFAKSGSLINSTFIGSSGDASSEYYNGSSIFVSNITYKQIEVNGSDVNDNNKTDENATTPVTYPAKVTANDLKMSYTDGSAFKVTVYGTDGKLASGVSVVIKIAGKKVATVKTNSKGVATYKPTQVPGSYKISATALGKTVTKKLTVKQILTLKTVKVKKSAKKLVLQATLAKVNGKYLKSKQITFKFNGKTYKAKTDKKGIAKVTIKKSILKKLKVGKKVKYQATYLKDTVKKTVKVKK